MAIREIGVTLVFPVVPVIASSPLTATGLMESVRLGRLLSWTTKKVLSALLVPALSGRKALVECPLAVITSICTFSIDSGSLSPSDLSFASRADRNRVSRFSLSWVRRSLSV